jgi:hypothetical protein
LLCKRIQLIRSSRARRLWAGLAVICALLAGSGVMASPAHAATVVKEHVCKVIGDDNPNNGSPYHQAVICTDLLQFGPDATGKYYAEGRTEALCQTSTGTILQCADIFVTTDVARATSSGTIIIENDAACGAQEGHVDCPAGRFFFQTDPTPSATCLPNVWGVTVGNGTVFGGTYIKLPGSDKVVYLSANFASPHASVGNC